MAEFCDFSILRELRKRENMSIADLSARSGISASVISKLERNCNSAEIDTLYRIAKVFGMTLSDFVSLAENRTSHCVEARNYISGDFEFSRVDYGNMRCMHAAARMSEMMKARILPLLSTRRPRKKRKSKHFATMLFLPAIIKIQYHSLIPIAQILYM